MVLTDVSLQKVPTHVILCRIALSTVWSGLREDPHLYAVEITDANSSAGKYGHVSKENGWLTSKGEYFPVTVIVLHGAYSHGWELLAVHFCLRT